MGYTETVSNNTDNYGRTIEHSLLVQFNIDVFDSHGFRVRIINVWEIYCTANRYWHALSWQIHIS